MKTMGFVAGLAVAVFAVAYFTSDVFSTTVDRAAERWSKWTPENIQKDPAGYLAFAKKELEQAKDSLEARQIALKKEQNENKRRHSEAKIQKAKYDKLLLALRSKYSETKDSNSSVAYPLTVNGIPIKDEGVLKKLAVKTKKKLDHQAKREETYAKFQKKLTKNVTKVEGQLEKLVEKQEELALQTEVVLLKLEMEKIGELNGNLAAIIDTSVAIAGESDAIDPDDLIDAGEGIEIDPEFDDLGW